jgi:hypothetical protein
MQAATPHGQQISELGENAERFRKNGELYDGLIVRLYWVRHGETIANTRNLVVGQSESVCLSVNPRTSTVDCGPRALRPFSLATRTIGSFDGGR